MDSKRLCTLKIFLIIALFVIFQQSVITRTLHEIRKIKIKPRYIKDALLNFTELTAEHGYNSEEHKVLTEDGYILTVFRMVSAKHCQGEKRSPPVLLMHGLIQSSDSFIESGSSSGLAYLISDGCYDLWIGNCRGAYYSRRHVNLDPDKQAEFWQFEIEEIGKYDLPAMINYVLSYTGSKNLNYIGFSQGAGSYLIMCSERPEYCDKTQIFIAISPTSRNLCTKSPALRFLSRAVAKLEGYLSQLGVTEVFGLGGFTHKYISLFCQVSDATLKFCIEVMDLLNHAHDFHNGSITNNTFKTLIGHFPAGTSLHNLAKYGQSMTSESFRKFDYGIKGNLERYGSEEPPDYNLNSVTVPVLCIYGENDGLVDTKDVEWLMSKLPNILEVFKVKDSLWTHLDVTYSRYNKIAIMPKINEYLKKYSS